MSEAMIPRSGSALMSAMGVGELGAVRDDWHAAELWIERLLLRIPSVSPATICSYRVELRRLCWYVETFNTAAPSRWTFQDAMAYLSFLTKGTCNHLCPRGLRHGQPGWTPFRSKPAASTVANSKKVLSSLYAFWQTAGYVPRNPFAGLGRGAQDTAERVRSVPPELLQLVYNNMERSPRISAVDYLQLVRNRFILRLLERTGLRAAEVVQADMDDIEPMSDPKTKRTYWSLIVRHGKGGTTGRVFLDDAVLEDLRVYRKAFGLEELPTHGEGVALILSLRTAPVIKHGQVIAFSAKAKRFMGKWRAIRRRQTLWDIVKDEFVTTAQSLKAEGCDTEAAVLLQASTHWLRHTFGTRLVLEGKDLRLVAQAMRHKNIRRTMLYTNLDFLDVARALERGDA